MNDTSSTNTYLQNLGTNFYNYSQDFTYAQDKTNIEKSINTYRGFIVGRYETTITSKEWDRIMTFKNSDPAVYDETHNIYDLAGNLFEWTLKSFLLTVVLVKEAITMVTFWHHT